MKKTKEMKYEMTIKNDALGDYFKSKEMEFEQSLNRDKFTLIRLDGMTFHTFTRPFLKPYDPFLHYAIEYAMLYTLKKVLRGYYALAYFQSDEISIILPKIDRPEVVLPHAGRIGKLVPLMLKINTKFYQTLHSIYRNRLESLELEWFKPLCYQNYKQSIKINQIEYQFCSSRFQ